MIADALALGGAAEMTAMVRRLSNDDTEQTGPPLWLILTLVVLFLACLIGCCTCCAVRCFAPENTRGPFWESSVPQGDGRWVRPLGRDSWHHGWVAGPKDGSGDVIAPRLNAPGEERRDGKQFWTPAGKPLAKNAQNTKVLPAELPRPPAA